MKMLIKNFLRDEEGANMVEYSLLAALIAIAAITTMTELGGTIKLKFTEIKNVLTSATPG